MNLAEEEKLRTLIVYMISDWIDDHVECNNIPRPQDEELEQLAQNILELCQDHLEGLT